MIGVERPVWTVFVASLCLAAGCGPGAGEASWEHDGGEASTRIIEEHWPNGKLRLRRHVLIDPGRTSSKNPDRTLVDHGLYMTWHDNGRKAFEASYIRGKLHGVETAWHKNGGKWTEAHYMRGLRHGKRTSWDQSGRKRKEEHYFEDRPDGTWTIWDESGKVKWQGTFNRGQVVP